MVAAGMSDEQIGNHLGRTHKAVRRQRSDLHLHTLVRKPRGRLGRYKTLRPSKETWVRLLEAEATTAVISAVKAFAGDRHRPFVHARWRAWSRARDLGFSVISIAEVSGFDHSSVLNGLRRLNEIESARPPFTRGEAAVSDHSPAPLTAASLSGCV